MKDSSKPPNHPSQPSDRPRAEVKEGDTPFDLHRYRIQTMPTDLRRELVQTELPLLDPNDLNDTNPPNGGLSAPETIDARSRHQRRSTAKVALALGLAALLSVGIGVVASLGNRTQPELAPATTVEAAPPIPEPAPKQLAGHDRPKNTHSDHSLSAASSKPVEVAPRAVATGRQPHSNGLETSTREPVKGSGVLPRTKSASPPTPASRVAAEPKAPWPPAAPTVSTVPATPPEDTRKAMDNTANPQAPATPSTPEETQPSWFQVEP